jgi:hypothetical protein
MNEPVPDTTSPKFQGSKTIFINQWMKIFAPYASEGHRKNISTKFYKYDPELLEKSFEIAKELWIELELGNSHKWHPFVSDILEFKSENPDSGIEEIVKDYHYQRRP